MNQQNADYASWVPWLSDDTLLPDTAHAIFLIPIGTDETKVTRLDPRNRRYLPQLFELPQEAQVMLESVTRSYSNHGPVQSYLL